MIDEDIWDMENESAVVKWKINVSENSDQGEIEMSYWIEDPNGEIVKSKVNKSTNISDVFGYYQKTFSEAGGYVILANITNVSCKDYNLGNNFMQTAIIVAGGSEGDSAYTSSINILDAPSSAEFGDVVNVKINVYRGDTAKYAVYAYVEDDDGKDVSEKSTMHFKSKFTNYSLTIPVQLDLNCNENNDEGDYDIVVEGLDIEDREIIKLDGRGSDCGKSSSSSSSSSSKTSSSKFEYSLVSMPSEIKVRERFDLKVELGNNDDEDYDIDIWSYVYRGSKCYSGEREENKQSFVLDEGESREVILRNTVREADVGDYNVKIKIIKDNQKTAKEITEDIKIVEEEVKEILSGEECVASENVVEESILKRAYIRYNPIAIYESSSYKAKKMVPILIISVLGLLVVLLILKR